VRSGIAQLQGVKDLVIDAKERTVRLRFPADKLSLQDITKAIQGEGNRFTARLMLQLGDEKSVTGFATLREAMSRVSGVQNVAEPNKDRIFLVSLEKDQKTMLGQLYGAALQAGCQLRDPLKSKKP
jgi:hypothetical protein